MKQILSEPVSEELQMFKDAKKLNWAWVLQQLNGTWKQFECIPCMILESKWQNHLKGKSEPFKLPIGTINFDRMTAEVTLKNGELRTYKIKRIETNVRARPDGGSRQADSGATSETNDKMGLIN